MPQRYDLLSIMVEPFYINLGRKIQQQRNARHMTQTELGEKLIPMMTRASIANIETGKQRVLVHTLVSLTRILQCELVDLLPADEVVKQAMTSRELTAELREKLGLDPKALVNLTNQLAKQRKA